MPTDIPRALGQIPHGRFLLTAAHDGARTGVLVGWVQPCAVRPPLLMTSVTNGLPVVPLIRDGRSFALCQIADDDSFLTRKFATPPDYGEDPFVGLETITGSTGAPIVTRALSYLDCTLVRHVDLEADCVLYVGLVRNGGVLNGGSPAIVLGPQG